MRPLNEQINEGVFLRWLDGGPLDGNQRLLLHGFLKTSVHPEEFLHKAVSLGTNQNSLDYINDGLILATIAAKKEA